MKQGARPKLYACMLAPAVCLWVWLAASYPAEAAGRSLRTIRLGVAVTESFKTRPDWKETFLRRLAYASGIFKDTFDLTFDPAVFMDWHPDGDETDMGSLIQDLTQKFPLENTDARIQYPSPKASLDRARQSSKPEVKYAEARCAW